ncbi:phage tail spike protein, partial [Streptococcus suis]
MISLKEKGILLTKAYEDEIEQEANGKYQLSFKYPTSDDNWTAILPGALILADDLHGEQEFRIFEVTKRHGYLHVYAEQVADDLNKYSISSISVDRVTGGVVMSNLAGSIIRSHPFSFYSDIDTRHTFNEKNVSAMSALAEGKHSILGQWGGDLVRDKYQISLLKNGGRDSEALFMYQKNLKAYVETDSIKDLVTRLHLSIKDSDVATTVDSPLLEAYNGRVYELSIEVSDQDVQTVDHLQEYGRNYFAKNLVDIPNNSLEIAVTDNQEYDVRIFDNVFVHHKVFGKDLRMKITSYKFSPMGRKLKSIGFGKTKANLAQQMSGIAGDVSEKAVSVSESHFEQKLRKEIKNADRVIDKKIEDLKSEVDDGIEQSRAEAERYADQIKTEISQEFDTFEHEYQATKQSQSQQIADILAKAQANTILATDAKNIGNQAKVDAANALSKAIQYKNEAIAEATRLDTVERQATETKLATAKSQAISEATRLVETAKSLLSGQISNISTDLSQTKEAIKLLATKATVDTLTGRVSSAEAMIQVQADQISQRVKTSDFDQAKQRISTAESSITQLGNRITTEISEIEVGGRNYFLNSDFSISSGNKGIAVHPDFMEHARGRKFIISVEVEGQNVVSQNQGRFGLSSSFAKENTTARDWIEVWEKGIGNIPKKRIYQVFEFKDEWSDFRPSLFVQTGGEVTVGFPKLEIGSLVTDYSKAPEDFIADITTTKTLITQTAEGQQQLSTRLTETQGKVTTAETNIRQLVNDVSSKVSQTNFDNLKKIVDSQATSISQNSSAINLKADKTVTDQLSETIKKTNAELQVTSDAVKTKVSSTDFDATKKRLETAETTIVTQADEIEKRLTSTQVETAISNKGYQTKSDVDSNITGRGYITNSALQPYALSTTVQNLVKETSDSFSRTISETRALIPTS